MADSRRIVLGLGAIASAAVAWLPLGASETIQYEYDARGRLISSIFSGAEYFSQLLAPVDLSGWPGENYSSQPWGAIDGHNAYLLTIQSTGYATVAIGNSVAAGDTISFRIALQAVSGSATTQALGLHSSATKWGSAAEGTIRIISGPGQTSSVAGTLWRVSGLSSSEPTWIEVTRTFGQASNFGAYLYIDLPAGYRAGQQLIAAGPRLARAHASQIHKVCLDDADSRTAYVSRNGSVASCPS